jgi:hypothetical protein
MYKFLFAFIYHYYYLFYPCFAGLAQAGLACLFFFLLYAQRLLFYAQTRAGPGLPGSAPLFFSYKYLII